jgi:ankyrin repeat protein
MKKRIYFIFVLVSLVSGLFTPHALWAAVTGVSSREHFAIDANRAHISFPEIMTILESGNTEMLALLLKSTPRAAQIADENGATPLHIVAFQGRKRPIELLLACGDSLTKTDNQGWTPLHYAVAGKRLHSVLFLLERGADCNTPDQHGNTPIFFAIANKQAGVVKALLKHGARTDRKNTSGETPLAWAQGGFQAFCRRLFAAQVPVTSGMSVTLAAPVAPVPASVADPGDNSPAETTPSPAPLPAPVEEFPPSNPVNSPARQASLKKPAPANQRMIDMLRRDDYEDLLAIVTETPDLVTARDPEGATLLHAAAFLGKREFAAQLLKIGMSVETPDQHGWTPLHYAVAGDQEETVRFLLAQGADPFARDAKNLSPVRMAGWGSSKRLAGLLLQAVAHRRKNNTDGYRLASARISESATAQPVTGLKVSFQADTPIAQGFSYASWTPNPDQHPPLIKPTFRQQQKTMRSSSPPAPQRSRRGRSFLLAVPVAIFAALAMHG